MRSIQALPAAAMLTIGTPSLAATGDSLVLRSCLDTASLVFSLATVAFDPPPKERQDEILNDFWREKEFLQLAAGPRIASELQNPDSAVSLLATNAEACFRDDAGCTRRQDLLEFGLNASEAFKQMCASDFRE